jgi:hypothetical protein
MFRPKEYPVSFTSMNGKMTLFHYKEEHKLKYIKVIIDWLEVDKGVKKNKKMNHYTKLFAEAIEKHGFSMREFIQQEIAKDDELKAILEQKGLI